MAVLAVDGTNLVAEAARRHGTAPTATAALGRTLLGGLLMGSFRKDDEAIQVRRMSSFYVQGLVYLWPVLGAPWRARLLASGWHATWHASWCWWLTGADTEFTTQISFKGDGVLGGVFAIADTKVRQLGSLAAACFTRRGAWGAWGGVG